MQIKCQNFKHSMLSNDVGCFLSKIGMLTVFLFTNISCSSQGTSFTYPIIKKGDSTNTYFSHTIVDPYQNLENENDTINTDWYDNQNRLATNTLSRISGRAEMLNTLIAYEDRIDEIIIENKIIANGNHFYLKRTKNENIARLYFKESYKAKEVLLYDPKAFNSEVDNNVISYFKPSWDGKKVVIAITNSGKEISDLIVMTVSNQTVAPEVIPRARPDSFLGISWIPDNSGFTFLQFGEQETDLNYSVLYKIGEPRNAVKRVFGTGLQKDIHIDAQGVYPIAKIYDCNDPYIIGYIATVENFWEAYISDINEFSKGTPNWTKLHTRDDLLYTDSGRFLKGKYIFKSNRDFESNALYKVNNGDFAFAKAELICKPVEGEILQSFIINGDEIYFTTTKNGVSSKLYKCVNGETSNIELPMNVGSISLKNNPSDEQSIFISLSGWTMDNQRYLYNTQSNVFELSPLSDKASYPEFNNIRSREVEIVSHDGVLVPLSIIYNEDAILNEASPTLFYGYGSYGTSIEPFYSTTFLHWVERGGILCIPHVRGGGEKGEQWHQDGMINKKENTWKDLIASAEYMINEGFTSKEKIAIYSSSAGGIMIGKAVTDRPDLFAAAIAEVPIMNPLRSEARKGGGGSNMLEYGTIKDATQVSGLINMDPYLSLEKNINYPAILLTAGENDPRVPKWMPGKFAARAQEFSISSKPILFRIDKDAGHGTVDEKIKYYQEYADVFSFAFWQTGHEDFVLKD